MALHPQENTMTKPLRHRLRALLLAITAVATLGAAACDPPPSVAPGELLRSSLAFDQSPNVDAADMAALAAGHLELARELLALTEGDGALSPVSITTAFSMLSVGAKGQTLAEIEDGLHLLPQERLHLAQNALELSLRAKARPASDENDGVVLEPTNQLFGAIGFAPEAAFLDTLAERYDAGLRVLDFEGAPEASRVAINGWVSDVTREKIPELIPEGVVTRDTRLALVNALYLKAAWSAPFQESATTDASFRLAGGAEVSVPTMHGAVEGRYAVVDGVQVLELPFTGGELALVLAIPRDGASEDAALAALGSADLAPRAMDLALPKFQVRKQLDLVKALKDLGVTAPFDEAVCDLSGINAEERLVVAAALHEAFVEVNEEGVEAAAATAILIDTKTGGFPDVEVKVDQPFVFAIVDQSTRMPLFVGRIHDPR
jgi:serpin B